MTQSLTELLATALRTMGDDPKLVELVETGRVTR